MKVNNNLELVVIKDDRRYALNFPMGAQVAELQASLQCMLDHVNELMKQEHSNKEDE